MKQTRYMSVVSRDGQIQEFAEWAEQVRSASNEAGQEGIFAVKGSGSSPGVDDFTAGGFD